MAVTKKYISEIPQLIEEWNWEKNIEFDPSQLTVGSGIKVWWKCNNGHEWQAAINHRNNGSGCPYCSGRYAIKGETDLQTINPTLAEEWHYEKNNGLTPMDILPNSGKKVWWKCSKGHEWQATVEGRSKGHGCPYCAGRYVVKGENDLQTVNPILAKEWNYAKNNGLTPMDVLPNSNYKVWWKCEKGHEWQTSVSHRTKENGCPYCSGRYAIKGETDLQTINPALAKEWNYEMNNGLTPMDVLPNSNKKVWWRCSKGHEWQTTINNRNNGHGCPVCNSERHTSFPEYAIEYYLKKYGFDVIHSYKEKGYELDIFIPSKKIAIEYDGGVWHKNRTKHDLDKNSKCKNDGIKLYRIREGLPSLKDSSLDYVVQQAQKDLPIVIEKVLGEIIGTSIDINFERDSIAIENLREFTEKANSLYFSNPEIASEWNYEKNGGIKPEYFAANSGKKVWWKCSKGHEWQASIANRSRGNGCPYCSSNMVLVGYNDLQTVNPILAQEWNYEKNNGLTPVDIMPNSVSKVWWKCSKGHEWQATVNNRSKGYGCPYCSGRYAIKGRSDLQVVNPRLASEWNYEKNIGLIPADVLPNSNKRVWWRCGKGHEWQAAIANRNKGKGCPYCAGRYVIKGENDLQTVNLPLAKEWNYEKNNELTPMDVMPNSNRTVWWKCTNGHEWQARIDHRNNGSGCPQCAKEKRKVTSHK